MMKNRKRPLLFLSAILSSVLTVVLAPFMTLALSVPAGGQLEIATRGTYAATLIKCMDYFKYDTTFSELEVSQGGILTDSSNYGSGKGSNFSASMLVDKKDGFTECHEILGTQSSKNLRYGSALSYFGIDNLSQAEILTDVLGFKAVDEASTNLSEVTITIHGLIYQEEGANYYGPPNQITIPETILKATYVREAKGIPNISFSSCSTSDKSRDCNDFLGNFGPHFSNYLGNNYIYANSDNLSTKEFLEKMLVNFSSEWNNIYSGIYPGYILQSDNWSVTASSGSAKSYKKSDAYTSASKPVELWLKKKNYLPASFDAGKINTSDDFLSLEQKYLKAMAYLVGDDAPCAGEIVAPKEPGQSYNSKYSSNDLNYIENFRYIDKGGVVEGYGLYLNGGASTNKHYALDFPSGNGHKTCKEIAEIAQNIAGGDISGFPSEMLNSNLADTATPPDGTTADGATDTDGTTNQHCFDGAEALGWLVCPVLTHTSRAVDKLYEGVVTPFLTINAELLSTSDRGTYNAWQIFQSFANVVFIILLLVVIFSQLTGIGIDNYGIKKILPKLIISAVLINLSYIICQLAVDISNIFGYGIKSVLDGAAASIGDITLSIPDTKPESISIEASALTGVIAALGLRVGGAAILAHGFEFILPVLLAVISAAIALLFTFVLLGVRQAGVVLLVALSPLAFVLYILPNTKSLFDKWMKMFTGLLLFFPIVGLLMGGGNLASRIILGAKTDDFFIALIAMLLNVIPFFFLPTLLKGSFAAMGNIGAKISGVSKDARGWATKKVGESNVYKDAQARMRAGVGRDGNVTKFGRFRAKTAGKTGWGKSGLARNREAYLKRRIEDGADDNMLGLGYEAAQAEQQASLTAKQVKNNEALIENDSLDDLQNGLERALAGNDTSQVKAYQNVLSRKGEAGRQAVHDAMKTAQSSGNLTDNARRAYSSNIMDNWAADYKNNSRSTHDFALKNTGRAPGVSMANVEATALSSLKQEQMATMDGAELQRYEVAMAGGNMSADDGAKLQALAYDTLHNEQLSQSIKGDQAAILKRIAGTYTPPVVEDPALQVQKAALRTQQELTAATQGAVGGTFKGRAIHRTPSGFKAVSRTTNNKGDLIMVDADGNKWNSHEGIYVK